MWNCIKLTELSYLSTPLGDIKCKSAKAICGSNKSDNFVKCNIEEVS